MVGKLLWYKRNVKCCYWKIINREDANSMCQIYMAELRTLHCEGCVMLITHLKYLGCCSKVFLKNRKSGVKSAWGFVCCRIGSGESLNRMFLVHFPNFLTNPNSPTYTIN